MLTATERFMIEIFFNANYTEQFIRKRERTK